MKIFLLIGIVIYFLSRAVLFMEKTSHNKTGLYYSCLMMAEVVTILVIIYQLFINALECKIFTPYIILGYFIFGLGIFISVFARFNLGKENWQTGRNVCRPKYLVNSGIYSWIRHPIYIGTWLMGIGFELALSSWLFFLVLFLGLPFIWFCSNKEEQCLIGWFGEKYQKYKEDTNWFFPIKKIKRLF